LRGFGEGVGRELRRERTPFLLGDVEFDVEKLSSMVYVWTRNISDRYPCVLDKDGPVPVLPGLAFGFGLPFPYRYPDYERPWRFFESAYFELERFYKRRDLKLDGLDRDKLTGIFRERLTRFVTVRSGEDEAPTPRTAVALGAARAGFTSVVSPYLNLEIQTEEPGLRIHYTPAYFIDWSHVFGSPTTPLAGWILPGRYKFGGMRMNGEFLIDNANFDVPPISTARLVLI
jgi:hypothetical protein